MSVMILDFTPEPVKTKRLSKKALADTPIATPFTIIIDSAEQAPFRFTSIRSDARHEHRPFLVQIYIQSLGPQGGDYSLVGHESWKKRRGESHPSMFRPRISIERKSMEDAHSTILGFSGHKKDDTRCPCHRCRFDRELAHLSTLEFAAVVVECTFGQLLKQAPEWGRKPAAVNRVTLQRSIFAWMQKHRGVQWIFCDSRADAEETTFRLLERFWNEWDESQKNREKAK